MSTEMPPCAYCGATLSADALFCAKCGRQREPSKPMFGAGPSYDPPPSGSFGAPARFDPPPSRNISSAQLQYQNPQRMNPQPYSPPPNYQSQSPVVYLPPPPPYYQGQPQGVGYAQPQPAVQQVIHHHYVSPKSAGTAAVFELLFGGIFQTFGIGHIYAGNVGIGIAIMFGYWFIQGINIALMAIFIGFLTWPICWLLAVVFSTIGAVAAVNSRQRQTYYG